MVTSELRYIDTEYDVTLAIKQATFADGLRRSALQAKDRADAEKELPLGYNLYAAFYLYPSLLCATEIIKDEGEKHLSLDMTQDELMELPDALVSIWSDAIWEKNPHWSPFGLVKALTSSTASSSPGTEEKTE